MIESVRLVVTGGRDYRDRRTVIRTLSALKDETAIELLIEGGATGADRLCREWALANGIEVKTENARWRDIHRPGAVIRFDRNDRPYDAAAGATRNQLMIDKWRPTHFAAFPGGAGTKDMTDRCVRAGLIRVGLA